eukprot:CAMPEP_0172317630 /NCGR_PEP_ID=MMETSP1058-20130122/32258_1 /TAXON_ID=83371 /ORGANISM="Detonula confervacea, Strain CCMP 353" /LENGTH=113 /DNA_ID=CAMNT_0013032243 /DNA_START=104 /DNA_END=442 /DNA_ORIENTATION=+
MNTSSLEKGASDGVDAVVAPTEDDASKSREEQEVSSTRKLLKQGDAVASATVDSGRQTAKSDHHQDTRAVDYTTKEAGKPAMALAKTDETEGHPVLPFPMDRKMKRLPSSVEE